MGSPPRRPCWRALAHSRGSSSPRPSSVWPSRSHGIKRLAGRIASRLYPKLGLPSGLHGKDMTHDPEAKAYDEDPLVFPNATARWFTETVKAQDRAFQSASRLTLPLYMAFGTAIRSRASSRASASTTSPGGHRAEPEARDGQFQRNRRTSPRGRSSSSRSRSGSSSAQRDGPGQSLDRHRRDPDARDHWQAPRSRRPALTGTQVLPPLQPSVSEHISISLLSVLHASAQRVP